MILSPYILFPLTGALPDKTMLFVVGTPGTLTTQDAAYKALFEGWGWTVTLWDDDTGEPGTITDSVVVISSSTATGTLSIDYATSPKGVVQLERASVAEGFYAAVDGISISPAVNSTNIVNTTHPITAGLSSGALTITTTTRQMSQVVIADLGPGADVLGEHPTIATNTMIFAYSTGSTMDASHVAEGRRVFLPFYTFVADLNAAGEDLLEKSIEWAAGRI